MRRAALRRLLSACLLGGLSAFGGRAAAADSSAGTAGVVFLETEQGARGIGMGGAYTAAVDDGSSIWWNPAGLARQRASEADFSHTALIEGINTEYLSFSRPLSSLHGGLGASLTYLSVPPIDSFDASKNSLGKVNANGYAGTLGYGLMVSSEITVGAAVKFVGQKLADESASGVAGDIGAQYRSNGFGLGLVVQNLGPSIKLGSVSSPLPRTIRGGGYYAPFGNLLVAAEEEGPIDAKPRFHVGSELRLAGFFALRGGFQQTPDHGTGAGFTVGFGLAGAFGGDSGPNNMWTGESSGFWERLGSDIQAGGAVKPGTVLVGVDYAFVSNGTLADINRVTAYVRF